MTDNTDKARSLILAALMVFSVFAGTVAFAGTAAAANSINDATLDPAQADGGQDVTHTLTFNVTEVNHTGDTDTVEIDLPSVYDSNNVSINSVEASANGTTPNSDSSAVMNGSTIEYTFAYDQGIAGSGSTSGTVDGNVDGETGEAVSIVLDDVKPGDSGRNQFCFRIVDNPAAEPIAEEAEERLRRALDSL